ncbi:hypothetical protein PSTT_11802 [Puccinia striiformis]|uniref:Uncharacterized protein n=1 Tax=Puccinia striiformis TaxID=27350 RepID=A0A2S4UYU2_9BASI|nr:hypothetical protein PSTT_11802 [Puccinia striiformis]
MCLFTRPAGFRAGRNFLSSHPLGFRSRINQKTSTQELFWLGHAEPDLTDIKCWLQKNFAAARFSTQVPQSNLGKRRGRHRNASSCESRSARSQYNDQSRRGPRSKKNPLRNWKHGREQPTWSGFSTKAPATRSHAGFYASSSLRETIGTTSLT